VARVFFLGMADLSGCHAHFAFPDPPMNAHAPMLRRLQVFEVLLERLLVKLC
jgi:hypothetical protein